VPCLRIDHDDGRSEWLRESADIIEYLEEHFGS
jgi:glutathione S-transferase